MAEERALFNANDGLTGRDGGPYLDEQEAVAAEVRRAKIEGREPDLDNPPASAGIVLLNAGQVLANRGINNLPSQDGNDFLSADKALREIAKADDNNFKIHSVVPAEGIDESPRVDMSMRTALAGDAAEEIDDSDEQDATGNPDPSADSEEEDILAGNEGSDSQVNA